MFLERERLFSKLHIFEIILNKEVVVPIIYSINSLGLFLVDKLTCGKRESVSWQYSTNNRRAVGLLNPMRDKN